MESQQSKAINSVKQVVIALPIRGPSVVYEAKREDQEDEDAHMREKDYVCNVLSSGFFGLHLTKTVI